MVVTFRQKLLTYTYICKLRKSKPCNSGHVWYFCRLYLSKESRYSHNKIEMCGENWLSQKMKKKFYCQKPVPQFQNDMENLTHLWWLLIYVYCFQLQSPVKTISISGSVQTENKYRISLLNVYDRRQPLSTVLSIDPSRRALEFYINYDLGICIFFVL